MGELVDFRSARRTKPPLDTVRLGYDFNRWCAELYRGERFARRESFPDRGSALAAVERFERDGLRRLPDFRPDQPGLHDHPDNDGGDAA